MALKSINPYNNKVIEEFGEFDSKQTTNLVRESAATFREWRKTSIEDRALMMRSVADLLMKKREKYARTITLEMGKPIPESRREIEKCSWVCEYYADHAAKFLESQEIATDADQSYVRYDPLGPVLGIMPWNFPFWQVFRFAAPTLMAGNTVLLKHASNVQRCALIIESIFIESGFPEGSFRTLVIGSGNIEPVIADENVRAVTFTGSDTAGAKVAEAAGKHIKKTVLELGGSNAFIILGDADLDEAVQTGIRARMQNGGQSCIAAKRFIVVEEIANKYINKLKEAIQKLKVGDPLVKGTDIGPLASIAQAEGVHRQVQDSIEKGAKLILGGKQHEAFYDPTLMTDVKPGMPAFDEEVFGPVLPISVVGDVKEAIELSNRSRFGLGVTVFTRDRKQAMEMIPEIEDGAVFFNELVKSDPRLPFGGTKRSGYGRELGMFGIREFVNIKTVWSKSLS